MSDFAPFVAAALRDKTIHELMEENRKLRERVRYLMAVEITGPEGQPVYARGQFDKDGDYHGNPHLWNVKFSEELTPCPLSELQKIEIWIGGSIRASFDNLKFSHDWELSDFGETDNEGGNERKPIQKRERLFIACFHPGTVWLSINIGWSQQELVNANLHFPEDRDEGLLNHLCQGLARADPSKVCKFKEIGPAVKQIKKLVESVPGATAPDILQRNRLREAINKNSDVIMQFLRTLFGDQIRFMTVKNRRDIANLYLKEMDEEGVDLRDPDAVLDFIACNIQERQTVLSFIRNYSDIIIDGMY